MTKPFNLSNEISIEGFTLTLKLTVDAVVTPELLFLATTEQRTQIVPLPSSETSSDSSINPLDAQTGDPFRGFLLLMIISNAFRRVGTLS